MTPTPKFPDGFEELILQKNFEELSSEELKQLGEKISAEDYFLLRETLIQLHELHEVNPEPAPAIRAKLMDAFDEAPGKKPTLILRLPVWTWVAAAAAVLIGVLFILKPSDKSGQEFALKTEKTIQEFPTSRASEKSGTVEPDEAMDQAVPDAQELIVEEKRLDEISPASGNEVADEIVPPENLPEKYSSAIPVTSGTIREDITATSTGVATDMVATNYIAPLASASLATDPELISLTVTVY